MALSTQRTERKKMGDDGDPMEKKATKGEHKVEGSVVGLKHRSRVAGTHPGGKTSVVVAMATKTEGKASPLVLAL